MKEKKIKELVELFLRWPLPKSVCSDLCVTEPNYKFERYGTHLLNYHEAYTMIEHLVSKLLEERDMMIEALEKTLHMVDGDADEYSLNLYNETRDIIVYCLAKVRPGFGGTK